MMPRFQNSPGIGYDISTYKNETLIGLRQATIDVFHNDLFFTNLYILKFHLISFDLAFCSFSLLAQRKRTKRKGTFFKVFFSFTENQIYCAKIFPRLQDFLTQNKSYTGEKRFQSSALKRQLKHWIKFYWMSQTDNAKLNLRVLGLKQKNSLKKEIYSSF